MPQPIALKLRSLRERRGLTQKEAAELADVSELTVYRLETGKQTPYLPTVTKIARAYGVPLESRSDLSLPRRDPLRELRLNGVLRSSAARPSKASEGLTRMSC
jgi:transcriptional regulator with XRE-family HTH domain